jgi:hypothetical protein
MSKATVDKDARSRASNLFFGLAATATLLAGTQMAYAQIDTISTATPGHLCAEDQYKNLGGSGSLGCTAKDLTAVVQAVVGVNTIGNCPQANPGDPVNHGVVDVLVTLSSGSPDRYDVGLFIGEDQNSAIAAGGTCSANIFPTSGTTQSGVGWEDAGDHNTCGDYAGNSVTVNEVDGVHVACVGNGAGNLVVPFAVVYLNNDNGSPVCGSVDDVTADSSSKCIHDDAAVISNVFVTTDANPQCDASGAPNGAVYDPVAHTLTLTVTVTNSDPLHIQAADGTTFSDDFSTVLPAGLVTVSGSPAPTCTPSGGAVCQIADNAGVVSGTITSFPWGSSVVLSVTLDVDVVDNPGPISFSQGLSLTTPPTVLPPSPPYVFDGTTGMSTNATACLSATQLPVKLQSFDVK